MLYEYWCTLISAAHYRLNPMSIVLVGTECMPDNPSSYEKLRETYQPVYIKYNIYDYGVRQTSCLDHARKLTWNAGSVVLTGILDPLVLKNNLSRVRVDFEVGQKMRMCVCEVI